MFNPPLDHICACQKYYPPAQNYTGFDFDFDSSFYDSSGDDVLDKSVGKRVSLWISLLVGAPLNIIILIVTLSNWQRKSSSSALFVVHLCIGMASKSTPDGFRRDTVSCPLSSISESIKSWLAHLYSSVRQSLRQKWQGFIWRHFDVSFQPQITFC